MEPEDLGKTDNTELDSGSLLTGWIMLSIAIVLFMLSLSIYLFGLETVFSNKRFPEDSDTPCFLAFLVMGIIFLNLGIVYRDIAVHPELFPEVMVEKSMHISKKEEWEKIKKRAKGHDLDIEGLPDGERDDES